MFSPTLFRRVAPTLAAGAMTCVSRQRVTRTRWTTMESAAFGLFNVSAGLIDDAVGKAPPISGPSQQQERGPGMPSDL
jgi:hypothetical protein